MSSPTLVGVNSTRRDRPPESAEGNIFRNGDVFFISSNPAFEALWSPSYLTITQWKIEIIFLCTTSKARLDTAVAEFCAQDAKGGVLFMGICPISLGNG
ncbi:NAD(P)-binding protein [Penicillium sp. DV-2018c]|nr:NAD(P)-binding protein [Penicillium sp. DV-2018c]